jgi:hypothetical protein
VRPSARESAPGVGQAEDVIQLAIDQQAAIGNDRGTAKLQHQAPFEAELQRGLPASPPDPGLLVSHKPLHSHIIVANALKMRASSGEYKTTS